MTTLHDTLHDVFGLNEFRPNQQAIIEDLVAGRDAFVLMPTGGGKSLCYQMAALHRPGIGIVVSPLISLMKDQVDALTANGVRAACYNSSLDAGEAAEVLRRLDAGELDLLYVAPERLTNERFLERLAATASRCSPSTRRTACRNGATTFGRNTPGSACFASVFPRRAAHRADRDRGPADTRGHRARARARRRARHITSFDRPNIRYLVAEKDRPQAQLATFLETRAGDAGIVYALSRQRVEEIAGALAAKGSRRHLPCRARRRPPPRRAGRLPARRRTGRRRDGRLRHGHRQTRRPLRGALRHAAAHRGLLPGDRTSRPRRAALDGAPALRSAGRRDGAQAPGKDRGRGPAPHRFAQAAGHGGLRREPDVPASRVARILRPGARRGLRQLRRMHRSARAIRRDDPGTEGAVLRVPGRGAFRHAPRDRRAEGRRHRTDPPAGPRAALDLRHRRRPVAVRMDVASSGSSSTAAT